MSTREELWQQLANYYKKLADTRTAEGPSIQLACLVLAEHCMYEYWGDRGGPSPPVVALAERVAGEFLDARIAAELQRMGV